MISSVLLVVFTISITIFIYLWFFLRIQKQYELLGNDTYIKNKLSYGEWMGKPITPKLIKQMSITFICISTILVLTSIGILISQGFSRVWAGFTGFGLLFIYGAIVWNNLGIRKNKIKANNLNIKFSKALGRIWLIVFCLIVVIGSIFNNIIMSSPYFQIFFISFILLIIIISEWHYFRVSN